MQVRASSLEFDDSDAFRDHLARVDIDIVQLNRGALRLSWNQVAFDDMMIAHHRVHGAFADASTLDPGWMWFVVCLAPTGTIWCGLEVEPGHLAIMGPSREHRTRIEQWQSLEIIVSTRLVEDAGILAGADLPRDLAPEQCLLPLDHEQATTFRALARSLEVPPLLEIGLRDRVLLAIRERTLEVLASAVAKAAPGMRWIEPPRRVARYDLALRALAMMDVSDDDPPDLDDLAARLEVSPRAIQYALKSALGVSPYQYLLARRLQTVRRDLLLRGTTVTAAAFDHGFWNLSRFASQYARLFGENPSQTLGRVRVATAQASGAIEAALGG